VEPAVELAVLAALPAVFGSVDITHLLSVV
jgi:hypothetical protein